MLDLLLCSMANYQMDVSVLPKTKTLVELIRLIHPEVEWRIFHMRRECRYWAATSQLPPFQTLLNEPSSFLVGILHGSKSFFFVVSDKDVNVFSWTARERERRKEISRNLRRDKGKFLFFFSIDTQKWNLSPYHIYINGPYNKTNNTL